MDLTPVQRRSIFSPVRRFNMWHGPVRTGKTVASIIKYAKWIHPDIGGAPDVGDMGLFGCTTHAIKRNIISPLYDYFGNDFRYYPSKGEATLWGRMMHVIGASDSRAEGKVRGCTLGGAYCDEVSLMQEDFFRMVMSRLSVPGASMFATTNPDSPNHWLKRDYLNREHELDMVSHTWGLRENTFLSDDFINALEKEYVGLWRRRFILGEWVLAEGAIYDMFDDTRHVVQDPPCKPDYYIIGVDYGTSNPTVFLMIGVKIRNGQKPLVWIENEYYYDGKAATRQKTDVEYVSDLANFVNTRRYEDIHMQGVYIDPSAASFKLALTSVMPVNSADNTVSDGIRSVSSMLQAGDLLICANCEHTIGEFGGYVWDAKKAKIGEDAPMKANDHCMDAMRYGIYTHLGKYGAGIYTSALAWD